MQIILCMQTPQMIPSLTKAKEEWMNVRRTEVIEWYQCSALHYQNL